MRLPFRLGSTSYVYSDTLVANARALAGIVDDIELVLFDVAGYGSNFPSAAQVAELRAIANASELTFTVHLPRDVTFGDAASYELARRAIDATRALNPFGYVMHLGGRIFLQDTSLETIARWQAQARQALGQIIAWIGDASRLCIENVEGWDPDFFAPVVLATGASRCVDLGHLWLQGCDPLAHLVTHLPRARVIHLHGIGSRDHQSLAHVSEARLAGVLELLARQEYRGVLTLEVFGEDDFFSSREVVLRLMEKR